MCAGSDLQDLKSTLNDVHHRHLLSHRKYSLLGIRKSMIQSLQLGLRAAFAVWTVGFCTISVFYAWLSAGAINGLFGLSAPRTEPKPHYRVSEATSDWVRTVGSVLPKDISESHQRVLENSFVATEQAQAVFSQPHSLTSSDTDPPTQLWSQPPSNRSPPTPQTSR